MKKYEFALTLAVLTLAFVLAVHYKSNASESVEAKKASEPRKLVLKKSNTVSLRMPIFPSTAQNVKEELIAKSADLPAGEPLYLYLETPGGSITAGESLIQTALGLGREIKTVNNFSASMG